MATPQYVLVTPARNEEQFIKKTIEAVIAQTVSPKKWIIVSDGSTDRTEEIVRSYAERFDYIELVTAAGEQGRNFGSKVHAINAGIQRLVNTDYDFIGNVDADVTFEPIYYQEVLERMASNAHLGIAGGYVAELVSGDYVSQNYSHTSVAGAIQLFRRKCWEDVGGYVPLRAGGIDAAAEIMARMNNWSVETFDDLCVLHHRRVSTGRGSILRERFRQGMTHFALGYHPLFQTARCLYRVKDRPYIGSLLWLFGYVWAYSKGGERILPDEAIRFLRAEQMARVRSMLLLADG